MGLKLAPDEKIICEAGLSLWLFQPSLLLLSATLFSAAFLFFADPQIKFQGVVMLLLVTTFVIVALRFYIIFMSTSIILTNRRVVFAKGFLQRQTAELYLTRTEGINVRQSLTARLMGYGTVEASGVGSDIAPIAGIAAPWAFHKAASEAINAAIAIDPSGGLGRPAQRAKPAARKA